MDVLGKVDGILGVKGYRWVRVGCVLRIGRRVYGYVCVLEIYCEVVL